MWNSYCWGLWMSDISIGEKRLIDVTLTSFNKAIENREKSEIETLQDIWQNYACDSDKGSCHSYIEVYDELFSSFRNKKMNFLEIGIYQGASLHMWRRYFTKAIIYGLDFNPHILPDVLARYTEEFVYPLLNENAYTFDMIDKLIHLTDDQGFDLIVDDGSHIESHQLFVLQEYGKLLRPGGIMVIEDIQLHFPNGHEQLLENLSAAMDNVDYEYVEYKIIDRRPVKNRYDDILFVVQK